MRHAVRFRAGAKNLRSGVFAFVLFGGATLLLLALASCGGNSCFTFTWDFPGPITTGDKSCTLTQGTGNITVRFVTTTAATAGPMAPNFRHVFVSLEGIEAQPLATTDENPQGWEELAPGLARDPMQIDLLAQPARSCAASPISRAHVAAGPYGRMRLRLVRNQLAEDAVAPRENACGEIGFHCVVASNGAKYPLIFSEDSGDLPVAMDQFPGGPIQILPDTKTDLAIEFNPYSSLAAPAGDAVRITPAFSVEPATSCDSLEATER